MLVEALLEERRGGRDVRAVAPVHDEHRTGRLDLEQSEGEHEGPFAGGAVVGDGRLRTHREVEVGRELDGDVERLCVGDVLVVGDDRRLVDTLTRKEGPGDHKWISFAVNGCYKWKK